MASPSFTSAVGGSESFLLQGCSGVRLDLRDVRTADVPFAFTSIRKFVALAPLSRDRVRGAYVTRVTTRFAVVSPLRTAIRAFTPFKLAPALS